MGEWQRLLRDTFAAGFNGNADTRYVIPDNRLDKLVPFIVCLYRAGQPERAGRGTGVGIPGQPVDLQGGAGRRGQLDGNRRAAVADLQGVFVDLRIHATILTQGDLGYDGGRFGNTANQGVTMSQMADIKQTADEIASGLKRLGPDRVVALSVHKTKDLIAELEEKAKKLVSQLESVDG